MKVLFASDLHGSAAYTKRLLAVAEQEDPDLVVLLGDIYNHGPRNPLPLDYAPMEVAEMLNAVRDKLLVIRGNCDSEVDQMISKFHFVKEAVLAIGNKKVYCTHGHIYNAENLPALCQGDVLVYGHFHTVMHREVDGITILNPGSISLPKDVRAYIVMDETGYAIRSIDGDLLFVNSF